LCVLNHKVKELLVSKTNHAKYVHVVETRKITAMLIAELLLEAVSLQITNSYSFLVLHIHFQYWSRANTLQTVCFLCFLQRKNKVFRTLNTSPTLSLAIPQTRSFDSASVGKNRSGLSKLFSYLFRIVFSAMI